MDKDVPGYIWDMKTASEDNANISTTSHDRM